MPWDIPVEVPIYRLLTDEVAAGTLQAERLFLTDPVPPEGAAAVLRRGAAGACVFFERDSHLCAVHRTLGEAALPATCRIFPRIALTDPRGTFITLSHFCPTAAAMLFRTDVPLEIVESPPAFPPGEYEGLDASGEWPPLLTAGVLMDMDGYAAWERHVISVLARASTPESAVVTISRHADRLRQWRPGGGPLADAVAALDVVIAGDIAGAADSRWGEYGLVVNRFLAAHAFANWTAYQGRGLRTWVRGIEAALEVLKAECAKHGGDAPRPVDRELLTESLRNADLFLRHLADRAVLLRTWDTEDTTTV